MKIQDNLINISKEIFKDCPDDYKSTEALLHRLEQEISQFRKLLSTDSISYENKLNGINEHGINLANFSLMITGLSQEIQSDINKDTKFTLGYTSNWNTINPQINKTITEFCNEHFNRLKQGVYIIDSLKMFYKNCIETIDIKTNKSIFEDLEILSSIKQFYKNQCYSYFIFNCDYFWNQCEEHYKEYIDKLNEFEKQKSKSKIKDSISLISNELNNFRI